MKNEIPFFTKKVETRTNAELSYYMKIKKQKKTQWLIPCWDPRVWSESGPVFKVCVLPWFLTQSKSSPTEGLLQLHKSVSKSQVPAMFEDRLISYTCILWTQIFDLKKINFWGVFFFNVLFSSFFLLLLLCWLITRLYLSQTWTTCSWTEWHVIDCYVSSKVSPPDPFKDHLNNSVQYN